jgi:hypothetical protein
VHLNDRTYIKVRDVLETKIPLGTIIECDYESEIHKKCFSYRLGSAFIGKGLKNYELKTEIGRELASRNHNRKLRTANEDVICRHLMQLYPHITLPTIEEIKSHARKLIKQGYHTKKGRRLCFLNKKKRKYDDSEDKLAYVEDAIEIFLYLTEHGFKVPTIGNEYSGGRIVDSFTLMPSFIRQMIKIDGEPIAECDYSALHPNIAMTLFNGSEKYITHQKVADHLGIDVAIIKTEHLSFFNKHPKQMKSSVLYGYYMEKEPALMKRLIDRKYTAERRYKITSQEMMNLEVALMTAVIERLDAEGILVGYVYDALFCKQSDAERVKIVMDEEAANMRIYTVAKVSYGN